MIAVSSSNREASPVCSFICVRLITLCIFGRMKKLLVMILM